MQDETTLTRQFSELDIKSNQGVMDNNNNNDGKPTNAGGDWRSMIPPDSRQRIVYKIFNTLKRHINFSVQEKVQEYEKYAATVEEKIYVSATSQYDYLRRISLKVLTFETKNPI